MRFVVPVGYFSRMPKIDEEVRNLILGSFIMKLLGLKA